MQGAYTVRRAGPLVVAPGTEMRRQRGFVLRLNDQAVYDLIGLTSSTIGSIAASSHRWSQNGGASERRALIGVDNIADARLSAVALTQSQEC